LSVSERPGALFAYRSSTRIRSQAKLASRPEEEGGSMKIEITYCSA